jgi:hypothetical protein
VLRLSTDATKEAVCGTSRYRFRRAVEQTGSGKRLRTADPGHRRVRCEDELTANTNAAVDLIDEGRLDEADQVARHLLERFPDEHDGWDRLGMVYQARGDNQKG